MRTRTILSILFLSSILAACQDNIDKTVNGEETGIENWIPDTFVGSMATAASESTTRMTIEGKYSNYSAQWELKDSLGVKAETSGNIIITASRTSTNNAVLEIYQGTNSNAGAFSFKEGKYRFGDGGPSTATNAYKMFYPYKKGVADVSSFVERIDTVPQKQKGDKIYCFASCQATYDAVKKQIPFKMHHDVAYMWVHIALANDLNDDHSLKSKKIKRVRLRNINGSNDGYISGVFKTNYNGNTSYMSGGSSSVDRIFNIPQAVPNIGTESPSPSLTAQFSILPISKDKIPNLVVEYYGEDDKILFSRSVEITTDVVKNKVYNIHILVKKYRTLNIFVPGINLSQTTDDRGVSDGSSYNIATGQPVPTNQSPSTGGDRFNVRYAGRTTRIFENPEYFGRYATYTSPVGDFYGVRWWTAMNVSDITQANLEKQHIDLIWYNSEHLRNVSNYINAITEQAANELYNYHLHNSNVGMLLITGNPSEYGPKSSIPNYLIQKYFGPIDVNNTGSSAIRYTSISGWEQSLFTSNANDINAIAPGVGDFIYKNGIFTATGSGTLNYGPIPEDHVYRWGNENQDNADNTYHDAAYCSVLITSKLKARDSNWIPIFYGQKNEANGSKISTAEKDPEKTILAYNPKLRIMWTLGASMWGSAEHFNACSYAYNQPFNAAKSGDFNSRDGGVLVPWKARTGAPMNTWVQHVRPVYMMPLNSASDDNSSWSKTKRYGSRAIWGCIADMIIRNNMGQK